MLNIGGKELKSRLFIGSGKYSSNEIIPDIIEASESQVITLAVRRVEFGSLKENMMDYIPKNMILMPNTSGARNADEAIRIARLAKAMGMGNWIKVEIMPELSHLLPDNLETLKATEVLAKEGFHVFCYMSPDVLMGKRMREMGAEAVMPLGSLIGSNQGLKTREMIQLMIDTIDVPIIVDAGIGRPSDACLAMEMGASAVLLNTAIATAKDPVLMAAAFKDAVIAGRRGFQASLGRVQNEAKASSPLTGFINE